MSALVINGDTSGAATIQAPAVAGSPTITLPTTSGTAALTSDITTAVAAAPATLNLTRKNAIINGDFNVWQRGTTFTSIATGAYSADRWTYSKVGAMVHDVSRSTDVPTVAQAGRLFNYSLLVDCTTVDAAIAAGDYAQIDQHIEGYNFLPLAQRSITLSFWVKGTKTGIYCVALLNSGADRTCVKEYTINVADTWEKKTLTFPASPSTGTWDYTTGIGLSVRWSLAAGSTYHTTADSYQTGGFFSTSNQVNATDNTANNFRLCGVQLEVGSAATEFEYRTFQEELTLCQRYYQKTYHQASAPGTVTSTGIFVSYTFSVNGFIWCGVLPQPMRTAPTAVVYSHATGATGNIRNDTTVADIVATITANENSVNVQATGSAVQQQASGHYTLTAEL